MNIINIIHKNTFENPLRIPELLNILVVIFSIQVFHIQQYGDSHCIGIAVSLEAEVIYVIMRKTPCIAIIPICIFYVIHFLPSSLIFSFHVIVISYSFFTAFRIMKFNYNHFVYVCHPFLSISQISLSIFI